MIPTMLYSLKVADWPRAEFSRGELVIPQLCPGCLSQQANWEWRIDHKYPLSGTRYWQTFYYCDACSDLMKHDNTTRRMQFWIGVLLFGGLFAYLLSAMDSRVGWTTETRTLGLIAVVVIPIIVVLVIGAVRRAGRPVPADAIGRRPAAFYTGMSVFGAKHVYRAARQEWIDALIAHNPASADNKEYEARIGQPKPDVKPF